VSKLRRSALIDSESENKHVELYNGSACTDMNLFAIEIKVPRAYLDCYT
jgi:hypothetical protein